MADEESKHEEHKPEESGDKKGGLSGSFAKHKTLWIVGGVGAAGVLLLLFMNSGSGSSSQPASSTSGTTTQGGGGAVDTSSLVGTGGVPSWYNPGAAENMDYWPYPTTSSTSTSSKHKTSSSSGGSSTSKSSGSSSKSSSSSSKSSGSSSSKSSSSSSKSSGSSSSVKSVSANPTAGGAHGYVYTVGSGASIYNSGKQTAVGKGAISLSDLSKAAWGNTSTIKNYANNAALLKYYASTGQYNPKTGLLQSGAKINL